MVWVHIVVNSKKQLSCKQNLILKPTVSHYYMHNRVDKHKKDFQTNLIIKHVELQKIHYK